MLRKKPGKRTGRLTNPGAVKLPGGVILVALPFKIVGYHDDGSPRLFEIQPPGPHDLQEEGACVLFAREEWIRRPDVAKAKANGNGNGNGYGP